MKQWTKPELINLEVKRTKEEGIEPILASHIYCNYCDFQTNDCSGIMSHLHSNAGKDGHPQHPNETDYKIDMSYAPTVCGVLS